MSWRGASDAEFGAGTVTDTGLGDKRASDDCPDTGWGDRRWSPLLINSLFFRRAPGGARYVAAFVWLLFIVFPLINAVGKHGTAVGHGALVGSAALFVAAYVTLVIRWRRDSDMRTPMALFVVLLAVATALTLVQASGWGFLFTYCAACAAVVSPEGRGLYAVALCSLLAGVTSSVAGADGGTVLGFVASSAGIGLLMLAMSDLRLRNEQLSAARAELARLAVAQERERFARDLHDLLGHSLSVIALKAELAGRMLAGRPEGAVADAGGLDQAATEVRELEQVARTALGEVREAVSGYRQPTLDGELAGARMALSAAGIEANVQQARVPLDPPVEAVLAWAVREGATNVIRHSGARHCTLRITASLTDAAVEVIDDGVGAGPAPDRDGGGAEHSAALGGGGNGFLAGAPHHVGVANGAGGHGIAGLAERARLLNGTIEAGTIPGGGYRLAVIVPVSHA